MILILVPIYLLIMSAIIIIIIRHQKYRKSKWITSLILAFIFSLPLYWDSILGNVYYNYLCKTQSGINVYEQVNVNFFILPGNSEPQIILKNGELNEEYFKGRYKKIVNYERNYNRYLNIAKRKITVMDTHDNKVLGKLTKFHYFGGWLINSTGFMVKAKHCPKSHGIYKRLLENIFINNK